MILLLGDIHGDFSIFNSIWNGPYQKLVEALGEEEAAKNFTVIQVGDFGFYDRTLLYWPNNLPFKVYAIDGNHEDYRILRHKVGITEMRHNLFYVSRGQILNLFGYKIGCCGGGFSIDKAWRTPEVTWFQDEEVLDAHIQPLIGAELDFIVTHTPPDSIIKLRFPPLDAAHWGLPNNWIDTSSAMIEKLYRATNVPIYCGHMHRSLTHDRVKILDIGEMVPIADKSV